MVQDSGLENLGWVIAFVSLFALLLAVLWTILPFAIFGIKGLLTNILAEQRHTTAAINSLRSDFRTAADKALGEPKRTREAGSAHL